MKPNTFKSKLQKEIFLSSMAMIIVVILAFGIGLFIYYYSNIHFQLNKRKEEISNEYVYMVNTIRNMLIIDNELFSSYLEGNSNERHIYTYYYNFVTENDIEGRLLLLNEANKVMFDSSGLDVIDSQLRYYLSILINDNDYTERVYLSSRRESFLVIIERIKDENGVNGYAMFLVDGDDFLQETSMEGIQYVLFDRHSSVFAKSSSLFIQDIIYKIEPFLLNKQFKYDNNSFVTQNKIINNNISLVVYIRNNDYSMLLLFFCIANISITVILLVQSRHYSQKIANNNSTAIEKISLEMIKVKENVDYRFSLETNDEFQILAEKINAMLDEIKVLHNNNLLLIKASAIAEKKMLEAQFNPHFLFNTLEAIRSVLHFDLGLANDLILNLNTILRYSIDDSEVAETINKDVEYLKSYLEIYNNRFSQFDYEIVVDDNAFDYKIPKLFLLPILENSIKYGFKSRKDLKIFVEIKKINDSKLFLRVKDNGGGIDEKLLIKLNKDSYTNHHGIHNSKRRIKLMYPKSTFEIKSHEGSTIVDIVIETE